VERVWNESRPNRRLAACSTSFTATYGTTVIPQYQIGCLRQCCAGRFGAKKLTLRPTKFFRRVKSSTPVDNGDAQIMIDHVEADARPKAAMRIFAVTAF
jgi:hypothetical protein